MRVGVTSHDDRARQRLEARGDGVHHPHHARLRLGRADREHREVLPVGEADEDALVGRLHVEFRAGIDCASGAEALLHLGEQIRGGSRASAAWPPPPASHRPREAARSSSAAKLLPTASAPVVFRRLLASPCGSCLKASAPGALRGRGRQASGRGVAALSLVRRRAPGGGAPGSRRRNDDRLVAAERTKRIARWPIDARPGRRVAGDLVEAGARVAEQLLLRHGRHGSGRIRRRQRIEPAPAASAWFPWARLPGSRRGARARFRPGRVRLLGAAERRSLLPGVCACRVLARRGCPSAPSPAPPPSPD